MENQGSKSEIIEKTGEDKTIAVIAYLTFIGLIIALVLNNDKKYEFANFHIKQSLGLVLISIGLFIIGMIPVLGWIISFIGSVFLLILWIFGLINAINYQSKPVPVLGDYFIDWFKNM